MANQQTSNSTNNNTESSNNNTEPSNNNNDSNLSDSLVRSTLVLQPNSSASIRNNETLRSRSADSRPINNNTRTSTTTTLNVGDDDSDWIELSSMDLPMSAHPLPNPFTPPMSRFRGPAIIRKFFPKDKAVETI